MYELIQLTDACYYIESPSKIGLIRLDEKNVCLIDSGNGKEAGRKIRQILDANAWKLTAIYNTHANADHIGGNAYLQKQTHCAIYAPPINAMLTKYPFVATSFLYGGYPPKDVHNSFLLAPASHAEDVTPTTLPQGLRAISLPGHFFDMVGYQSSDDVLFLADCLFSKDILDRYQIPFICDVEQYLTTLERVQTMQAAFYVPAHGEVTSNIAPLAQYNIDKVYAIAEKICTLCTMPLSFEDIMQKLFTDYQLAMDFNQYVLVGVTVRSLLSWLKAHKKIDTYFENNRLFWHTS